MKKMLLSFAILLSLQSAHAQKKIFQDTVVSYFNELKQATKNWTSLWDMDIYGPVLLVNPSTRVIYANDNDTSGILKLQGKIYIGTLPANINIANTAIEWGGKRWAMIMLPLPANKKDRINLLAHELFHKAQTVLGYRLSEKNNNHLDTKDGRIYLRLELEALKKAVKATTPSAAKQNIADALAFRKYRHTLYPGADTTENKLELNEGLAEYTGMMISNRNKKEAADHFDRSVNQFLTNPTFVRSFAYQTIPMYGYLLQQKQKDWNKKITVDTNLGDFFVTAFGIQTKEKLHKSVAAILSKYNAQAITAEENEREARIKKLLVQYKKRFIESPHFVLHFQQMNISFDPGNIMPLEDKGTVYPTVRVSDKWGVLEVSKGALISSNWDKIIVSPPTLIDNKNITGDGWTLTLNDGYTILKEEKTGIYKLVKK